MKTLLLLLFSGVANAGTGWYTTIYNHSADRVNIMAAGADCWDLGDFSTPQLVNAFSRGTFYSEQRGCIGNRGILGLDIAPLASGAISGHIEFYQLGHPHSVDKYISGWTLHGLSAEPSYAIGSNHNSLVTSLEGKNDGSFNTITANLHIFPEDNLPPRGEWIHNCLLTSWRDRQLLAECQDESNWGRCTHKHGCPYIPSYLDYNKCQKNSQVINYNGQLTCVVA